MKTVEAIAAAVRDTGYHALYQDYEFADVLHPDSPTRRVPLAAFSQTPASYRSSAIAVVYGVGRDPSNVIAEHRALGAPLLFVVSGENVSVWHVRAKAPARAVANISADQLPSLFKKHQLEWAPESILRAKSIGPLDSPYQLDFVDAGLMTAIEGEIHTKLDRLLREALLAAGEAASGLEIDSRRLFQVVFRLITAKILADRGHAYAEDWNADDLGSVLSSIERHYVLPEFPVSKQKNEFAPFEAVWSHLRGGISFCNISADDLAFVYENTLVTRETRQQLGTHSTPRQVAEYVVRRLELWRHRPETLSVYEPFSGAGVFLVSALRHMRTLLPITWDDRKRHKFLVKHLSGDEVDAFACEVATLSLILADYPNENGWRINNTDLFSDDSLVEKMRRHNIILCNPPFESFRADERKRYAAATRTHLKPVAVLDAALDANPWALGFVLPRAFILERKYAEQRRRIEQAYKHVELVELPERTFEVSQVEAALLIAREPRSGRRGKRVNISLRSTEVAGRDRSRFLKSGEITTQRELTRPIGRQPTGELWIPTLRQLWQYLEDYPRLGGLVTIHRGLEWKYPQGQATSADGLLGFRRGLHTARNAKQFSTPEPVWIDCRAEQLRGYAIENPWHEVKIIANAGRISRGPWRVAAAVDTHGLVCSQQFFGIWPKEIMTANGLFAAVAILNSPLANAYIAVHSPTKGIRIGTLRAVPVPPVLPHAVSQLVAEYLIAFDTERALDHQGARLSRLLTQIDAAILSAYDLPPRLERQLLDYFSGAERPVPHEWKHWDETHPAHGLRLAERLTGKFNATGDWIAKVFQPLPADEAALLRHYGE